MYYGFIPLNFTLIYYFYYYVLYKKLGIIVDRNLGVLVPRGREEHNSRVSPSSSSIFTQAQDRAVVAPGERDRDRDRVVTERTVVEVEELAWEENLRSELLEQSITYDNVLHATDSAILQPQSARLGSAGALSTGTVSSQVDRSGRIISSRRESGTLGITPGVPSSANAAITALQQHENENGALNDNEDENETENENKTDIDLGVQFRTLLLAAEDNVDNHSTDDCRFYPNRNHTGGTVTPMEGVYAYNENSSFDVSLRASPDMSMMGLEGKKDYSYDCTPQIVQREGRILRSHTSGSENTEIGGLVLGPDLGFADRDVDVDRGGGGGGGGRRRKDDGKDTAKESEDGQTIPWKPILPSTSFDSFHSRDSDGSMSDEDFDDDSFLEEGADLDPDMEFDFYNNMGLQQAILSSIVDTGDDPSSQSKVFIMGFGVTLSRLRCLVVSKVYRMSRCVHWI